MLLTQHLSGEVSVREGVRCVRDKVRRQVVTPPARDAVRARAWDAALAYCRTEV